MSHRPSQWCTIWFGTDDTRSCVSKLLLTELDRITVTQLHAMRTLVGSATWTQKAGGRVSGTSFIANEQQEQANTSDNSSKTELNTGLTCELN